MEMVYKSVLVQAEEQRIREISTKYFQIQKEVKYIFYFVCMLLVFIHYFDLQPTLQSKVIVM